MEMACENFCILWSQVDLFRLVPSQVNSIIASAVGFFCGYHHTPFSFLKYILLGNCNLPDSFYVRTCSSWRYSAYCKVSQIIVPLWRFFMLRTCTDRYDHKYYCSSWCHRTIVKTAQLAEIALASRCHGNRICAWPMQKVLPAVFSQTSLVLGSAPVLQLPLQTKEPVRRGLVSMTGTFIDTIANLI